MEKVYKHGLMWVLATWVQMQRYPSHVRGKVEKAGPRSEMFNWYDMAKSEEVCQT